MIFAEEIGIDDTVTNEEWVEENVFVSFAICKVEDGVVFSDIGGVGEYLLMS